VLKNAGIENARPFLTLPVNKGKLIMNGYGPGGDRNGRVFPITGRGRAMTLSDLNPQGTTARMVSATLLPVSAEDVALIVVEPVLFLAVASPL
jgi:hypothetical protein